MCHSSSFYYVLPGAEPLARLLPPYIPPPPPRAPSFPGPNSKPSPPIRNPSLSTPPVSSPHPQDSLCGAQSPPPNRPQTPTSAKNQSQLSVPASQRLHHPLDLSSVSEPLTEDLLLRLLQEHPQVNFPEQFLSICVFAPNCRWRRGTFWQALWCPNYRMEETTPYFSGARELPLQLTVYSFR